MDSEVKQWVTSGLVFVSGLIVLANQFLAVPPDIAPWLAFAAAGVDLALAVFFGRAAVQTRRAKSAAKAAK